jgi:hypothetical protein
LSGGAVTLNVLGRGFHALGIARGIAGDEEPVMGKVAFADLAIVQVDLTAQLSSHFYVFVIIRRFEGAVG